MPFDNRGIKEFRLELGLSQRRFADAMGVPQSTVYRWESGISFPNANHLGRMFDLGYERGIEPKSFFVPPIWHGGGGY